MVERSPARRGLRALGKFVESYPSCLEDGADLVELEMSIPGTELWTDTGVD